MDTEFVSAVINAIQTNDPLLETLLDEYPFESLDTQTVNNFYIGLLDEIYGNNKSSSITKMVLKKWESYVYPDIIVSNTGKQIETNRIPFHVYVACKLYTVIHLLEYVMSMYETTFVDTCYPLIKNVNDKTVALICLALDTIFKPDYRDYQFLYDFSVDINIDFSNYMKARLTQRKIYKKIPNYVKYSSNKPTLEELYKEWDAIPPEMTRDQIADAIFEKSKEKITYTEADIPVAKSQIYDSLDPEQVSQVSKVIFWEQYTSKYQSHLFETFGLSNPSSDVLDGENHCTKFGGCRMLLCTCYASDSNPDLETGIDIGDTYREGVSYLDWYPGYCIECATSLRSISHAVRIPMEGGGWKGCFCTFKCAKRFIENLPGSNNFGNVKVMYSGLRSLQMYLKDHSITDTKWDVLNEEIEEIPTDEIDMADGFQYEKSGLELDIEADAMSMVQSQFSGDVDDIGYNE